MKRRLRLTPPKQTFGATFRQHDAADHLAVGGEHRNAVLGLPARPGAPQVALDIDPHAVGAARLGTIEFTSIGGLGAVVYDIVNLDRPEP